MNKKLYVVFGSILFLVGIAVGAYYATNGLPELTSAAIAKESEKEDASKKSLLEARSVGTMDPRNMYFPGTEALKPDEMRIVACGTGMPASRRSQAASCFLLELGNGDKFIFDIGTGSAANLASLNIPYDFLDKVFVSHLHTDHVGDLDALHGGGWTGGRHGALRVWGPSGDKPELGTKYFVEKFEETWTWDRVGRLGVIPSGGGKIEVHEFDYKGMNDVVYQKNGVTIRSWPAIHCIDGSVSYLVEWNGLKFVFGGDTVPNKWFIKYAKGADFVIHESFMTPELMMKKYGFSPMAALNVAIGVHTAPAAFGKVMAEVKPRMAVAYHFFNDYDTRYEIFKAIRSTYDGPLTMAKDLLVWNVNKKDIRVRQVIVDDDAWPTPSPIPPDNPDPTAKTPMSKEIESGRLDVAGAFKDVIDAYKKKYNIK